MLAFDTGGVFGTVLFVVVIIAALIGTLALVSNRGLYDQIGRGGLSLNEDVDLMRRNAPADATPAERDEEIRQMLEARNERRRRQGEPALDVEAEMKRMQAPPRVDPGLREEVRQLVIARNERRAARGEEPLDIEAEIERQLRDLGETG